MNASSALLKAVTRAQIQRLRRRPVDHVLRGVLTAVACHLDADGAYIAEVVPDEQGHAALKCRATTGRVTPIAGRLSTECLLLQRCLHGVPGLAAGEVPGLESMPLAVARPIWADDEPVAVLVLGCRQHPTPEALAEVDDVLLQIGTWLEHDRIAFADRRAQRRLEASEARHRGLLEGALDAILATDPEGRIVEANAAAQRWFAPAQGRVVGQRLDALIGVSMGALGTGRHAVQVETPGGPLALDIAVHATQTGDDDLTVYVLRDTTERHASEAALQALNTELTARVDELARLNRENELLGQFGGFLQACDSMPEVHRVLARFLPQLVEGSSGSYHALSGRLLEQEVQWGACNGATIFGVQECWALRRGEMHHVAGEGGLPCPHSGCAPEGESEHSCMPVMTGDGALGLVHLSFSVATPERRASVDRLLRAVADRLGAALTNLALRERLRQESIRDPLTRLFNRRYMVETMERELARARRSEQPVAVVMIDVDHFKGLNDTYGHDVGDRVLQAVAQEMQQAVRAEDVVCRYGGEEFVAILPGATEALALARAESLRLRLGALRLKGRDGMLPAVTVSAGVAMADRRTSPEQVLRAADRALLHAKQEGRDRVCFGAPDGSVRHAA